MASKNSHAAWQTERTFTVRVLPEEGEPTELAAGLGDYLEAVDLATEWVERTDPKRTGTTPIEIVESREGGEATVWEYPPDHQPPKLVQIFGFDPVGWVSGVQDFKGARRTPTPAPPLRAVQPRTPVSPPLKPQAKPQPAPARVPTLRRQAVPTLRSQAAPTLRSQAVPFLHSAWADPVSRACLLVGVGNRHQIIAHADRIDSGLGRSAIRRDRFRLLRVQIRSHSQCNQ